MIILLPNVNERLTKQLLQVAGFSISTRRVRDRNWNVATGPVPTLQNVVYLRARKPQ